MSTQSTSGEKSEGWKRQDSHVPLNNFNYDELVGLGTSHNLPKTHTISHSPRQTIDSTVPMPMADGTSLLRVIEDEITRVRGDQGVGAAESLGKSNTESAYNVETPMDTGSAKSKLPEARDEQVAPDSILDAVDAATANAASVNTEPAPYWVERPFEMSDSTVQDVPLTNAQDLPPKPTALPTSVADSASKKGPDPKAKIILQMYQIKDRHNQEVTLDQLISLDTSMAVLQMHIQEECYEIAIENRLRLSIIAQAHQCFHFRACPDFSIEPSRNFYITNDDKSECRIRRVRDLFHTYQIDNAVRAGTPLSLRFRVEMAESHQPTYDHAGPLTTYDDWHPQYSLWATHWIQAEQDVNMILMTIALNVAAERKAVEVYKDLTGVSAAPQGLSIVEQEQKFAAITSQIPRWTAKVRQPVMTFNRYERASHLAPTSPPSELYLAIRLFSHLSSIGFEGWDPAANILLKIPADRTADKIKRALIQELRIYSTGQSFPQPGMAYCAKMAELLREEFKEKWNLQIWAMPRGEEKKMLHVCRKKEDFREFLTEGGGDGLYLEGHLVPSEKAVEGMFGKQIQGEDKEKGIERKEKGAKKNGGVAK